ncbi:MAG: glycogen synthase GlgA [Planctomycetota bacterium]|nr:glycogen synthase GlgA [Planctomycetota bacterium]
MKVVMATSEMVPFAKTGGLADVSGALPKYLGKVGVEAVTFMPLYSKVKDSEHKITDTGVTIDIAVGDRIKQAQIFKTYVPGTKAVVYLVGNDEYFDREELYGTPHGDYADNASRFVFFSRAVLECCLHFDIKPDVIHCHDWQSALIPVYVKTLFSERFERRPATLLTIHNLAYQGVFWHWDMKLTGLSWELFNWRELEFHGKLNFLKGGIVFADAINTVSPTYAKEIQTPEFGAGMQEILRFRSDSIFGIINGIDYDVWNPKKDEHIPCKFGPKSINNKGRNKKKLLEEVGLPTDRKLPLIGMISRLAAQKGLDLIAEILDDIAKLDVQVVLLGTGEKKYQDMLEDFSKRYPEKICAKIMFDNGLAHRIEAGSDMFLMPSRYEPCGLNQLYSLKYGTLPIVRKTGGLADTITDVTPENIENGTATGFMFERYNSSELLEAIKRAVNLYSNRKVWREMVQTAMKQDWSWGNSARKYSELYEDVIGWKDA